MNLNFSKSFLAGLAGGILGYLILSMSSLGLFGSSALYSLHFNRDQNFAVPSPSSPMVTPTGLWESVATKTALNSVAIQVFQNNKLVRQGSGLVVSSDGLIITTYDLAVSNAVYQVFYEDKILKAGIAASDYNAKLLLLKSPATYSDVADFNSSLDYQTGQDILITGKLVDLSKPVLTVQRGVINYITEKTIVIDAKPNSYLSGFGIVNSEGKILGMSYLRKGQINLVKASVIESFIRGYFEKNIN